MATKDRMPLSLAARELRVSGEVARRLTLKGILQGELCDGRWYVSPDSVQAVKTARLNGPETKALP